MHGKFVVGENFKINDEICVRGTLLIRLLLRKIHLPRWGRLSDAPVPTVGERIPSKRVQIRLPPTSLALSHLPRNSCGVTKEAKWTTDGRPYGRR